jgi:hypothetical protein
VASLFLVDTSVQPTKAAAAMRGLGEMALKTPQPVLREGEYRYTRSVGTVVQSQEDLATGSSWSYTVDVEREVWIASDGSGRLLERYRHPRFLTTSDEDRWREAGSPRLLRPLKRRFEAGGLTTGGLDPSAPDADALDEPGSRRPGFRGLDPRAPIGLLAGSLGESPATSELRSTLFDEGAAIPGMNWDGEVLDPIGRAGVGVSIRAGGSIIRLVFDPIDGALLSLSVDPVDTDGPSSAGNTYAFVERGVVDSVKDRP